MKRKLAARIENGIIYIHGRGTFTLTLRIEMKNLGVTLPPEEIGKIAFVLRDDYGRVVEYMESESDGTGRALFAFGRDVMKKLSKGRYNYDVVAHTAFDRITVADRLTCVVV